MDIGDVKQIEDAQNFHPIYSEMKEAAGFDDVGEQAFGFDYVGGQAFGFDNVGMVDAVGLENLGRMEASGASGNGRKKKDQMVSIEDTVGKAMIWHGN